MAEGRRSQLGSHHGGSSPPPALSIPVAEIHVPFWNDFSLEAWQAFYDLLRQYRVRGGKTPLCSLMSIDVLDALEFEVEAFDATTVDTPAKEDDLVLKIEARFAPPHPRGTILRAEQIKMSNPNWTMDPLRVYRKEWQRLERALTDANRPPIKDLVKLFVKNLRPVQLRDLCSNREFTTVKDAMAFATAQMHVLSTIRLTSSPSDSHSGDMDKDNRTPDALSPVDNPSPDADSPDSDALPAPD
eukprot:m.83871 g.83871  ORF g.83871 m.83871 type:complete len:243 (-) comp9565_c0_seq2:324-1052(-)